MMMSLIAMMPTRHQTKGCEYACPLFLQRIA
jgi:hypothetical protein